MALLSAGLAAAGTAAGEGDEQSDRVMRFDIPQQRADQALIEFAEQAAVTFIFPVDQARKVTANAVRGDYTQEEALERLLAGTGLEPSLQAGALTVNANHKTADQGDTVKKRGAFASIIAALVGSAGVAANTSDTGESTLEEIIVTAQKRSERLQDVPVPMTALSGESLVESNQLRLEDYFARVPGLNLTPGFYGPPVIAIRGITAADFANPTVGIVLDDVPYGPSTVIGGGSLTPDIDPSDLAQIEVLRGPQGTLYGASSIGGLLKYVTVNPSTDSLKGRLQVTGSNVRNGNETGYSVRGAVNVPVTDTLAVRASGYTRVDPGYIDARPFLFDPTRSGDGVNRAEGYGGRVAALWQPTDRFSLKLSALIQDLDHEGRSVTNTTLGDFRQALLRGAGGYDNRTEAYAANMTLRLGGVNLTSISGYNTQETQSLYDWSPAYGTAATQPIYGKTNKFTQELRVSSSVGERFEWLAGAFYTDEDSHGLSSFSYVDPVTLAPTFELLQNDEPSTFKEYAVFADLTFHLTDRFDIQIGGRQSRNEQTYAQTVSGPYNDLLGQPDPSSIAPIGTDDSSFTYLLTPRFKVSPDLMIYARFASGYRPGGPNINGAVAPATPRLFKPDTTQNYEVGLKGDFLNRALSIDVSVYRIDWKDTQLNLFLESCSCGFFANATEAKSEGVELSVEARPLRGLTISGWAAWNDAVLTEDVPANQSVFADAGDRLPFSSRISGSLAVSDEFPLSNTLTGFVATSVNYVGDRKGNFKTTLNPTDVNSKRPAYPGYAQIDLRAGVEYGSWTMHVFANNVTDKRGILRGDEFISDALNYIQPRTVGLSVAREFGR